MKHREYHQSAIGMFLKCGKQWEFRYERGLVIPPKAALTVGSAVDAGVTKNLSQKITTKTDLQLDEVLDAFSTDFDKRATTTDWDGDDAGAQKDMGAKLVKLHHEHIAPKILPRTVQQKFTIETDAGYSVGGTIDLTEEDGTVADTKTSSKKYSEDAILRAIQPAMYDFASEVLTGKKPKKFRYDVLIKTKVPAVQQVEAEVTIGDREHLFDAINNMHKSIEAGIALPAAEGSWWCSKDWCGYWSMCKGKKK